MNKEINGENLEPFEDDNGKWGFEDKTTGKVVIEPKFDWVDDEFNEEGKAHVEIEGDRYNVDLYGNLHPYIYDPNEDGYAKIEFGGKYGVIDKDGNKIIPLIYDCIRGACEQTGYDDVFGDEYYAKVKIDEKWGVVDKNGKEIVSYEYNSVGWEDYEVILLNGLIKVELDGKFGCFNKNGDTILHAKYDSDSVHSSDEFELYQMVSKKTGKYIGGEKEPYHLVSAFIDDKIDKCGVIDENGNIIIPLKYHDVGYYDIVEEDSPLLHYPYLKEVGDFITPTCKCCDRIGEPRIFYSEFTRVNLDGKWGLLRREDDVLIEILPCEYDHISAEGEYGFYIQRDGKWGLIQVDYDNRVNYDIPCVHRKSFYIHEGELYFHDDN